MSVKQQSWLFRVLSKSLLMLFGVILALVVLEVILRIYNPMETRIKGDHIVLATNKTYHVRNDVIKGLDPEITITKNSLGFRGANPPNQMEKFLTLVTIGGSTTQCFFLSDDQTWTARLGKNLERSFNAVWINNAGLDGHSTYGHLILLQEMILPLHPKVALFLVGANDVARGSNDEWDAENVRGSLLLSSPRAFIKSLSAYSEVVALGLNMYRNYTAYRAGLIDQQIELKKQGYMDIPPEEQKKYVEENANVAYLKSYEERLKKIIELCKKGNIEPVFVTQPLLIGFGTDDVTGIDLARVKAYGPRQTGKMYWDLVEAYNSVTRRVAQDNNALVIDLAKQMPKSSRYFYDFIHYTPQGAQIIADIVNQSLCPMLQTKFPQYVSQPCPVR